MPRRTVTLSPGFDKAIRSFQARMIVEHDRDVTFTEALNSVLCLGFLRPGPEGNIQAFWKPQNSGLSDEDFWELVEGFDIYGFRFFDVMATLPKLRSKSD